MATLSKNLIETATAASKARVAQQTNNKKLLDLMYAEGIRPEDLESPKKGEDRTFYDGLRDAVVAGFPKEVQALLAADVKALNEEKKPFRFYWQQQIGSTIKDWKKGLKTRVRQAEAQEKAEAGEVEEKTAPETTKKKQLISVLTWAQKVESTTIKDLPSFVKDLQSAIARIPD